MPNRIWTRGSRWVTSRPSILRLGSADGRQSPRKSERGCGPAEGRIREAKIDGSLLNNPAVQSVGLPFVVALVLVALIRLIGGADWGRVAAVAAIPMAFLVAYTTMEGLPLFPPAASKHKVFYLVLAGLAVGLAIDAAGRPRRAELIAIFVFPALCLLWLGWRRIVGGPSLEFAGTLAALWVASVIILWRLGRRQEAGGLAPTTILFAVAVGAGGISFVGKSASLSMLAGAVGAAAGAVMAWMYVARAGFDVRYGFGAIGLFGAAGALLYVVYVMALYASNVSKLALAVLLVALVAQILAERIPFGSRLSRVLSPVLLGGVAVIPVAAAVGLAILLST